MTRLDQLKLIANRVAAGAVDRDTAEQQVAVLLSAEWRDVRPERLVLDLATALLKAESQASAR